MIIGKEGESELGLFTADSEGRPVKGLKLVLFLYEPIEYCQIFAEAHHQLRQHQAVFEAKEILKDNKED